MSAVQGCPHGSWRVRAGDVTVECVITWDEDSQVTTIEPVSPILLPADGVLVIERTITVTAS